VIRLYFDILNILQQKYGHFKDRFSKGIIENLIMALVAWVALVVGLVALVAALAPSARIQGVWVIPSVAVFAFPSVEVELVGAA